MRLTSEADRVAALIVAATLLVVCPSAGAGTTVANKASQIVHGNQMAAPPHYLVQDDFYVSYVSSKPRMNEIHYFIRLLRRGNPDLGEGLGERVVYWTPQNKSVCGEPCKEVHFEEKPCTQHPGMFYLQVSLVPRGGSGDDDELVTPEESRYCRCAAEESINGLMDDAVNRLMDYDRNPNRKSRF